MRSLIKKILKESNDEWFEELKPSFPDAFVLTFCETPVSMELMNRFSDSISPSVLGSKLNGMWDKMWVNDRISHQRGRIVMYFEREGNTILWIGWDDCKNNSIKKYDYVFTIDEFLKIFER